jgi:pilus assembly protein Flp/PilA
VAQLQELDFRTVRDTRTRRAAPGHRRTPNSRKALRNCRSRSSVEEVIQPSARHLELPLITRVLNNLRESPPGEQAPVAQPLRWAGSVSRQAPRSYSITAALPQFAPQTGGAQTSGEDLMSMLLNYLKSFVREEEGQDLLEYALLVALIALIAIGAVGAAGNSVSTIFQSIADQLAAAA